VRAQQPVAGQSLAFAHQVLLHVADVNKHSDPSQHGALFAFADPRQIAPMARHATGPSLGGAEAHPMLRTIAAKHPNVMFT